MKNNELRVKLASFEGPMDLLLYLIRQNEIDIREIKISEITDHYLNSLEMMREFNLDIAGDFILMASTLILIKSRKLLPQDEIAEDEGSEDILSEEALVRRLMEHQRYQEVARQFKEMPLLGKDTFKRPPSEERIKRELDLVEMSVTELSLALQKVLMATRRPVRKMQKESVNVETALTWIWEKIQIDEAVELSDLFPATAGRSEIVATFLAILELGRLKKIRVLQHIVFGSIYVVARDRMSLEDLTKLFRAGDSYAYEAPQASN